MPEWEYVTVSLSDLPVKTRPVDVLNDAGEQGWELVTISLSNLPVKPRPVDVLNDAGGQGWQLVAITTNNICVPEAAGPETTLTTEAADSNA